MMFQAKLKLILTLSLCALIIGYWGFQDPAGSFKPATTIATDEVDGFLIDAVAVEYAIDGSIKRTLITDRANHFPESDKTMLVAPDITLFRDNSAPTRIQSQSGEIEGSNNQIHLRKAVRISDKEQPQFRMETEYLKLDPDRDYGETDAPVMIYHQSGQVSAIGMKLYLDQDRIQLLQDVRGIHEPN